jgi:hypothetical protein
VTFLAFPLVGQAAIVNGGFETGDFTGWTPGGNNGVVSLANLVLDQNDPPAGSLEVTPFDGEFMGALAYPAQQGFVYDNFIYQDVQLGGPEDQILQLQYYFWTYDEAPFDNPAFTLNINNETVFSLAAADIGDGVLGTLDSTGWQLLQIDLAEYFSDDPTRPVTIRIEFGAGNSGDNQFISGVFLDQIELVPIPTSLLLLGSGLIGLIGMRRKLR